MRARRLSVRGLWGLASWALPLALVFLVTPVLLRALGSERFGVLMIVFVTPLLASQLDFGIAASSVRRLAAILTAGKIDAGRTLATFAIALGAIGSVLGLIVWIMAPALSHGLGFEQVLGYSEGESLIRWCAVWVAVTLFTPMPGVLARAAQALGWITIVQTLSAAALWLSALAVARSGRPLTDIVAGRHWNKRCRFHRYRDRNTPARPVARSHLGSTRPCSAPMHGLRRACSLRRWQERLSIKAIGS